MAVGTLLTRMGTEGWGNRLFIIGWLYPGCSQQDQYSADRRRGRYSSMSTRWTATQFTQIPHANHGAWVRSGPELQPCCQRPNGEDLSSSTIADITLHLTYSSSYTSPTQTSHTQLSPTAFTQTMSTTATCFCDAVQLAFSLERDNFVGAISPTAPLPLTSQNIST